MSKRSSMAKTKHQISEGLKRPSIGHTLPRAVEPPPPSPRRHDFPMLVANPGLHYLDSAATSQKPRAVLDAIRNYYEKDNANPHRGAYELSARSTQRCDNSCRTALCGNSRLAPSQSTTIESGGKYTPVTSPVAPTAGT